MSTKNLVQERTSGEPKFITHPGYPQKLTDGWLELPEIARKALNWKNGTGSEKKGAWRRLFVFYLERDGAQFCLLVLSHSQHQKLFFSIFAQQKRERSNRKMDGKEAWQVFVSDKIPEHIAKAFLLFNWL